MMGVAGQFLRDAVAGEVHGACCTRVAGEFAFDCRNISEVDCFGGSENPDPDGVYFYPNLQCSEVTCGTQACCLPTECVNAHPTTDRFDPITGELFLSCATQGGDAKPRGTQCATPEVCEVPEPPEARPEGCINIDRVAEARPGGPFTYNTDLCQNAQFRMTIRPPGMWPADPFTRLVTSMNYGEPVSVGPIRANEMAPGEQACRTHFGKVVLTKSGYARMMMCGKHVRNDPDTLQVSEGRFYIEKDPIRPKPVEDRIDDGYVAVVVGHRTPYWVEAIYHSSHAYCEQAV